MIKKLFSTFLSILVAFSCFGMCSNNVSAKGADRVIILHYRLACIVDSKSGEWYNYRFNSGWKRNDANSFAEIKNDVERASSVMASIDDSVKQGTKLEVIVEIDSAIGVNSSLCGNIEWSKKEQRSLCVQLNSELGCDNIKFIPRVDYSSYHSDIYKANNVIHVYVLSDDRCTYRSCIANDDAMSLAFEAMRDEKFDALITKGDRTKIYAGELATDDIERFKFSTLIERLATGWIPSYEYFIRVGKSYKWMTTHTEEDIKRIMYETQPLYIPENHNFSEELINPEIYEFFEGDILDKNEFAADHHQDKTTYTPAQKLVKTEERLADQPPKTCDLFEVDVSDTDELAADHHQDETTDTSAQELAKTEESLADQPDDAEPKSGALKKVAIGTGIVAIPAAIYGVYKYVSNFINKKSTPQMNQNLNSNTSDVVAESRL